MTWVKVKRTGTYPALKKGMSTSIMKPTLFKGLSEMVASEEHLCSCVKIQEEDPVLVNSPDLLYLLSGIRAFSEEHLEELHRVLEHHGDNGNSLLRDAMLALAGTAMTVANKLHPHSPSEILREDYISLNMIAVDYKTLHTTGLAAGCTMTADAALKHLRDYTIFIKELSQTVVPVAVEEVKTDNSTRPRIAGYAAMNIKHACRML